MLVSQLMSGPVISLRGEEPAALAARLLSRGNFGALPVCGPEGRVVGIVTDRDLVTRCMAPGMDPAHTPVSRIMSRHVTTVEADTPVEAVMALMGREQIRRLPVTAHGRLAGMVSLSDLCRQDGAGTLLAKISDGVSRR